MPYERTKKPIRAIGNVGPRLDRFDLDKFEVGDEIAIPLKKNKQGKMIPEFGFNVKAANEIYKPFVFRKMRDEKSGALLVQRVK